MEPERRKGGRPSHYRTGAAIIAARGATQPEIAAELGCTNRTISRWALLYPEFRAALDRGLVRRAAEQRWAETAPLRAAATELRRMIAQALAPADTFEAPIEDRSGGASASDRCLTSTITSSPQVGGRSDFASPRMLAENQQDTSPGEPFELLDPRSGW